MKFLILVLLIFSLTNQQETQLSESNDYSTFMQAFLSSSGIRSSLRIRRCLYLNDPQIFFNWLFKVRELAAMTVTGNYSGYMIVIQEARRNIYAMEKNLRCILRSKSFRHLLNMENYTTGKNNLKIEYVAALYIQAFPNEWIERTTKAYNLLLLKDYSSSGKEFGIVFSKLVKEITANTDFISLAKLRAFYSGMFLKLGLDHPSEIMECLQKNGSHYILKFYQSWARMIHHNGVNLTSYYFNNLGLEFYRNIPQEIWECFGNSTDSDRFKNAVGYNLDPYDKNLNVDILSCTTRHYCSGSYYFSCYAADTYWDSELIYIMNADLSAGMDFGQVYRTFRLRNS